jgi:hypothetical protein
MSKQVYFVIAVDVDRQEIYIDDDTFTARFHKNEQVWDTETEEWLQDGNGFYHTAALTILNNKAQIERD